LGGDLKKWREAGVREMVDKHYQKWNLKLVALGQTPERTALTSCGSQSDRQAIFAVGKSAGP
jgi:hypothetical protein